MFVHVVTPRCDRLREFSMVFLVRHCCGDLSEQVCCCLCSMVIHFCFSLGATQVHLIQQGGSVLPDRLFAEFSTEVPNVPSFQPAGRRPHTRSRTVVIFGGRTRHSNVGTFFQNVRSTSSPANGDRASLVRMETVPRSCVLWFRTSTGWSSYPHLWARFWQSQSFGSYRHVHLRVSRYRIVGVTQPRESKHSMQESSSHS